VTDWALQASGRYVHAPDYVEKTASRAGWKLLARTEEKIRKEQDTWVKGDLFLLVHE
jgi:predicted TPR repeat methyltransferase